MTKWTKAELDWLRTNAEGKPRKELFEAYTKKFGIKRKYSAFLGALKNHHIRTGVDYRFKPGHTPHTKGKPMSPERYAKCRDTMFKPGNVPENHLPIGTERVNGDGYLDIKVSDPKTWKAKHRILWEEAFGPVPEGCKIKFADGNKLNCVLDNLILVTDREHGLMNLKGYYSTNPELTKSGLLTVKVMLKASERRKR